METYPDDHAPAAPKPTPTHNFTYPNPLNTLANHPKSALSVDSLNKTAQCQHTGILRHAPNRPLPPLPSNLTTGIGKHKTGRKGPSPIKWSPSKERQLVRLYEITDVSIEDIPVVLRDPQLNVSHALPNVKT